VQAHRRSDGRGGLPCRRLSSATTLSPARAAVTETHTHLPHNASSPLQTHCNAFLPRRYAMYSVLGTVQQMYSIAIQTQYIYCTFEHELGMTYAWPEHPNVQYIHCVCMVILYICCVSHRDLPRRYATLCTVCLNMTTPKCTVPTLCLYGDTVHLLNMRSA